ncbi:MAG: 50S ribosomal protein L29 [Oligoflexia bacterium]|nr:50S ribosomal protein L29 [Oligoflexia bacterium]
MKAKELRGFTLDDLKKRSKELAEELFNTRLLNISGSLENTAKIKDVRRTLARVKTIITEKVSR